MNKEERSTSLCQEAIRIPGMPGQEKQVTELMKHTMTSYSFGEVNIDKYGSVLGMIRGSRPGRTILMDGHIDTVDVIDRDQQTHGPFTTEVGDGKVYGRDTFDTKGSVCAMIMVAAQYVEDTGKDSAGTIYVSCTVCEECFEGVSSREISQNAKPDFVTIGRVITTTVRIGQRGRVEVVIETEGKSCHSSNPEKDVSTMYHMMAVIETIRYIQVNEHPTLGKDILELTDIASSPYPGASMVPFICRTTSGRRTLAGEDEALILGQAEEAVEKARKGVPDLKAGAFLAEGKEQCWAGKTIEAGRYLLARLTDEKDELVQKALTGLREAGINALISHFSLCINGSHFCGGASIPCIGFGSLLESLAHVGDEHIEIEQPRKTCREFYGILS